jgi:glycosyltransferase involved in cell wall biosynthesis
MPPTRPDGPSAVIHFVPEAYTTTGPKLMGRNAAGESFLRGYARHASVRDFRCFVEDQAHAKTFAAEVAAQGRSEPVRAWTRNTFANLIEGGCLYTPGPGIGEFAWQRRLYGDAAWSLTGVTHTTASSRAMDAIADLLSAPVQPWDAVICTSTAVLSHVRGILDAQRAYLEDRVGASRFIEPMLPVIPLGLHCDDFVFSDAQRTAARRAIGAGPETLVVLFTGRLSFHAKAHPLAMYQALERARRDSGREIMLVECGWHANASIQKAFSDAQQAACPSVPVRVLDGRRPDQRAIAWASGDVFCSLSDNIQETFGLVPIEAMAAGMPVVVSDWNGYKDTVRDGVDGFRIATLAPPPGSAADIAGAHAVGADTYDIYCGETCMVVAVDIAATATALTTLAQDQDLRRRMGEAGRDRARTTYDWAVIVPQYQDLWAEMERLRIASPHRPAPAHPWPARIDPFTGFADYPTRLLTDDVRLALPVDPQTAKARFAELSALNMVNFGRWSRIEAAIAHTVIEAASGQPVSVADLVLVMGGADRARAVRMLARLVKLGVLRTVD